MTATTDLPSPNQARHSVTLPVAPGRWMLDPAHSRIGFSVRHLGIANVRGQFSDFDVTLTVGQTLSDVRLYVRLGTASVATGVDGRDAHLRGKDFFDVEQHTDAMFESHTVREVGEGTYAVVGQLTLRGVRAPLTLLVQFEGSATDPWGTPKLAFSASAELDRTDWGLVWNQPLEAGGFLIGRTVKLEIDVQLKAAPQLSVLERVRALETRIRAHERDLETDRTLPAWLVEELTDAGVFSALRPASLGGHEMHPVEWMEVVEELSRINGSAGWLAMINSGVGWANLEPNVARRLLVEHTPGIMAGNQTPGGRAAQVEGGWRITGRWKFTSGSLHSQLLSGACVVIENDAPVMGPAGPEMRNVVFLRDEIRVEDTWDGMGLRGTGSHDMIADDVFVPDERVSGRAMVSPYHDGPLYKAMFMLMAHSGHALGIARAALETAVETEAKGYGVLAQMMGRDRREDRTRPGRSDRSIDPLLRVGCTAACLRRGGHRRCRVRHDCQPATGNGPLGARGRPRGRLGLPPVRLAFGVHVEPVVAVLPATFTRRPSTSSSSNRTTGSLVSTSSPTINRADPRSARASGSPAADPIAPSSSTVAEPCMSDRFRADAVVDGIIERALQGTLPQVALASCRTRCESVTRRWPQRQAASVDMAGESCRQGRK